MMLNSQLTHRLQVTAPSTITIATKNVNSSVALVVSCMPGNIVHDDFASLTWTNGSGIPLVIISALPALYSSARFGAAPGAQDGYAQSTCPFLTLLFNVFS